MREIKFRAWDKTTKGMVDDYAHVGSYGELYTTQFHSSAYGKTVPDLILLQYIGEKDKTETELYHKDIINFKVENRRTYFVGVINWSQPYACWVVSAYYNYPNGLHSYRLNEIEDIERVGAIFENPELLNKEAM